VIRASWIIGQLGEFWSLEYKAAARGFDDRFKSPLPCLYPSPPTLRTPNTIYLITEIGIRGLLPLSLQAKLLSLQQRADNADESIQWKITH